MSIVTKYICDHCGNSQDNHGQMWSIGLIVECKPVLYDRGELIKIQRLWCRSCCDKYNLIKEPQVKPMQPLPPRISFEDKVREIVREEIEAAK